MSEHRIAAIEAKLAERFEGDSRRDTEREAAKD